MSETNPVAENNTRKIRHRSRIPQIPIYLGKLFRGFLYENDWKFLPGSAIIAMLVSMVVRRDFFPASADQIMSMEGTLKGAFALTCVAIWNGCFNSIQVICRERAIIKREHRSGMHISSYVIAHMVYQAFLCAVQTILTIVVCRMMGVAFPTKDGFITDYFVCDLFITMFLISYASDMISLLVSAMCHSTTTAMTVMPFLLIFQLVFSGGIFKLPDWAERMTDVTISNYGLKCIAAQSDYNNRPLVTAWDTMVKLSERNIDETITPDQILSTLENKSNKHIAALRETKITEAVPGLKQLGDELGIQTGEEDLTVGDLVDFTSSLSGVQKYRYTPIPVKTTVGTLFEFIGGVITDNMLGPAAADNPEGIQRLKALVQNETAKASQVPEYERDENLILYYWTCLCAFILIFSVATVVILEFIDKDKR